MHLVFKKAVAGPKGFVSFWFRNAGDPSRVGPSKLEDFLKEPPEVLEDPALAA